MPFEIVRNDISCMQVDAIVNTANPKPVIGSGTDAAIHAKAGPELLEARKSIGNIHTGCSEITAGYRLSAKYVIHTVGPIWRGGLFGEAKLLRKCYHSALDLALENGCESIAFPLISTGNYGFPRDKALQIAVSVFSEFLLEHDMRIYLVVWDRDAFQLSEKLFRSVASYIDENYVQSKTVAEYGAMPDRYARYRREMDLPDMYTESTHRRAADFAYDRPVCAAKPAAPPSLDDMLANTDAGFTETLLRLIDQSGKKDSVIYKKANISKQHFSKIRNNPAYKPTKSTAVAFAIALELDLEQTNDLIGRAGYVLNNSSKFDVIITYFIREKRYDIYDINAALFKFDQMMLGV